MRFRLPLILLALGALAAACGGGGGGSNFVPGRGLTTVTPTPPGSTTSRRAAMTFYIPAPAKQSSRRPLYISSNTQSFGILAVPVTSTETPNPLNIQIFPVATPSPCAPASGGGLTCTFNVLAPIGQDIFYIGAFAAASPGPTAIPLSELVSGEVNVGVSPSPGATPYSFTLNGIVNSVVVTVPSPDPGNTPNTEVFTAGVPSVALPLGITAYDSAGNVIAADPTTQFADPITIGVLPTNGGVGLALSSQCSVPGAAGTLARPRHRMQLAFGSGSPSVLITCAADVNNVTFGYDGTPHPDPSDHLIDTFAIGATQIASPAPSPAAAVIQSNILNYEILASTNVQVGSLHTLSSGQLMYVFFNGLNGLVGTFDPSTSTASGLAVIPSISYPLGFAVAPNGTVWMNDDATGLYCWTSVASATSGAAATTTFSAPIDPGGGSMYMYGLTVDNANNVWITGYDGTTGQSYVGYFAASTTCSPPALSLSNFVTLTGDTYDSSRYIAPLNTGGIAFNSSSNAGMFVVTTANGGGNVSGITPALGTGVADGGVGVGANGTIYAAFYNSSAGAADLETAPSSGSPLTSLAPLLPNPGVPYAGGEPEQLSVFSVAGVPNRVAYVDGDYTAVGFVGLYSSPTTILTAIPNNPYQLFQIAYDDNGAAFVLSEDNTNNLWLSRVLLTTTWNVPVQTIGAYSSCGTTGLLSIDQRTTSSGPFTVTVPATVTSSPLPGSYNGYLLTPPTAAPFSVTVKDANGRTETYPNISVIPNNGC